MTRRHEAGWARESLLLLLAAACVAAVLLGVDLSPRVESDFFFSTDDPQLQVSEAIGERFPSRPQLILRAAGEIRSPEYAAAIGKLTEELAATPGVASVQSLTRGPSRPEAAFDSPFWRRLLVPRTEQATNLVVLLGDGEPGAIVTAVEKAAAGSNLDVEISGVPYVVELIRRYLRRDLALFSAGAILVFGLVIGVLFRSPRIVAGTLAACLTACALTLGLLGLAGLHLGILTANLVTIVFVLTLSHAVFLSTNWRRLAAAGSGDPVALVKEAVRLTLPASFWCMAATLLSFLSLLSASAKPLRELGLAGAVGTALAIVTAYTFYPPFLRGAKAPATAAVGPRATTLGWKPAVIVTLVCLAVGLGALRLSTDPSLLSFFRTGSELRRGLELIDADGGSSPLSVVVRDPAGEPLDSEPAMAKLGALQSALEEEPAAGTVLSASPLLQEARRASPMAAYLPSKALLTVLEQPTYDRVALAFMSPDHKDAHFFLRMREAGRTEPRQAVIARVAAKAREAGLEPELVGGLYELQGKLGELVAGSLATGLAGLLALFFVIGSWVSRSLRAGLAMVASLALVPIFLVGGMGLLGMPLDFISSPAAQVAIGIGVDSMIQLAAAARRARREGLPAAAAWLRARSEMGSAVVSATLIVALGFALFALSSFPPTQRFGLAVALGTLMSGAVALYVLPPLAAHART